MEYFNTLRRTNLEATDAVLGYYDYATAVVRSEQYVTAHLF